MHQHSDRSRLAEWATLLGEELPDDPEDNAARVN